MAFTTKYPNFFSYSTILLVPLAETISEEPLPESLQLGGFILCSGDRHSQTLCLIHNTAFANCVN